MFTGFDHVAIAVPDTEEALTFFRDQLGLTLLYSEEVNNGTVRLTHLTAAGAGDTHVQLVEPLTPDHPIRTDLAEKGMHLHHICFQCDNVDETMQEAPSHNLGLGQETPHQGTQGKRAFFLDGNSTRGLRVEVTGA